MDYNKPFDQTNPAAGYVNGNPATNTAGSIPCAEGLEYPQREIVNAERVAGLTPSNGDLTQLAGAIGRGIWLGALALSLSAHNAMAGAIGAGAALQNLPAWTKLRGFTTQSNTTATVNVTVTGVGPGNGPATGPLLRRDGQPLAVGDVPVGSIEFQPDGAGNFRLIGPVPSELKALVLTTPQRNNTVPYTAAGTYSWTVPTGPTGVYWVYVSLVGAGGGSAGGNGNVTYSGGGGGSGGYSEGWVAVTPGQVITIVVGAGGGAGPNTNGAVGGTGGTTSFGSYMSATGGGGGKIGSTTSAGGGAGLGSGGSFKNQYGSVGGDGNPNSAQSQGGQGAASALGGGGRTSTDGGGSAGLAPGSGAGGIWGSGGMSISGAAGAPGAVYIQY